MAKELNSILPVQRNVEMPWWYSRFVHPELHLTVPEVVDVKTLTKRAFEHYLFCTSHGWLFATNDS